MDALSRLLGPDAAREIRDARRARRGLTWVLNAIESGARVAAGWEHGFDPEAPVPAMWRACRDPRVLVRAARVAGSRATAREAVLCAARAGLPDATELADLRSALSSEPITLQGVGPAAIAEPIALALESASDGRPAELHLDRLAWALAALRALSTTQPVGAHAGILERMGAAIAAEIDPPPLRPPHEQSAHRTWIFATNVAELELSPDLFVALQALGIAQVRDLLELSPDRLSGAPALLTELRRVLAEEGLALRGERACDVEIS